MFIWNIVNGFLDNFSDINWAGVWYLDSTVSLMNSSVSNFWPGSLSISVCMLKLGTFFRNSADFLSSASTVSKKSSFVISEKGRDWVQHLLHCQSGGREKEFFLVSLAHFKWLIYLQVVHCGMLAPFLIFPEHVSHLVFLGSGAQLVNLLLKKSRISLVSKKARGNAEWWHWSHSQSTPWFFKFRYSAMIILAHLTWTPFLQW